LRRKFGAAAVGKRADQGANAPTEELAGGRPIGKEYGGDAVWCVVVCWCLLVTRIP
jgi:hypothetical protein